MVSERPAGVFLCFSGSLSCILCDVMWLPLYGRDRALVGHSEHKEREQWCAALFVICMGLGLFLSPDELVDLTSIDESLFRLETVVDLYCFFESLCVALYIVSLENDEVVELLELRFSSFVEL